MKKGKPSQKGNGASRSKFLTRMLVRLGGEGEWWNRGVRIRRVKKFGYLYNP